YVDGRWCVSDTDDWVDVVDPARRQVAARVPRAATAEVDLAVTAASAAWQSWRWVSPFERAKLLHALGEQVAASTDDIAVAITREMGKPHDEARGEVRKLAKTFHC